MAGVVRRQVQDQLTVQLDAAPDAAPADAAGLGAEG
jgi:hypothetical protein